MLTILTWMRPAYFYVIFLYKTVIPDTGVLVPPKEARGRRFLGWRDAVDRRGLGQQVVEHQVEDLLVRELEPGHL